jgi:hypothetical protein
MSEFVLNLMWGFLWKKATRINNLHAATLAKPRVEGQTTDRFQTV